MSNLSTLKTPGVHVDEVSLLPPSVAAVETGIPAFVGYTQKNVTASGMNLLNKPVRITSMLDYVEMFGGAQPEDDGIKVTISDTLEEILVDKTKEKLVRRDLQVVLDDTKRSKYNLYYSLIWYFANGGGPCYIVSVGTYVVSGTPKKDELLDGIRAVEAEDEPTMIVVPEAVNSDGYQEVYEACLLQAAKLGDRMAIIDVKQTATVKSGVQADMTAFRNLFPENRMFGAAYYPHIDTTIDVRYDDTAITLVHNKVDSKNANEKGTHDGKTFASLSTDKVLQEEIRTRIAQIALRLPPGAAIAAVWAKTDAERGVWKAPANVGLANVIGPSVKIDDETQGGMNVDVNGGKSVNAIRTLTGRGAAVVWGARTLMAESNEWRYVNVRRFFNFVEESVKKSTYRFVFEPNDANTWVSIRAMIENFLTLQWRAGALQGVKPEHAFFVRVGLGQTMTADDILNGRLIVEIGMAVVRPAEFIVLRFMHKIPES
jgi:phage tail sheath protein FI